jgi:hypothetical protein
MSNASKVRRSQVRLENKRIAAQKQQASIVTALSRWSGKSVGQN